MNHFVEGPLRDPSSLNKPSTWPIGDANMIGTIPGTDVHWGLVFGIVACLLAWACPALHHLGLRHAGDRRQPQDRAHDGPRCRPLRAAGLRCRRRGGGARRHGRGRGGAWPGQRLARRRLRLFRHPGVVPRAPQSAGDHPGGDPAGRHRRLGRPAAAPARPAGRRRGRAAGHPLRRHPGQRDAVRPAMVAALEGREAG